MSEWKEEKVLNLCSLIVDCVNRTAPTVNYPTPYKMIRTTNVRDGKINVDQVRYVTEETYKLWVRRGKPEKDDIILTREAPVGEVGLVTTNDKIFLGQRTMLYRANPALVEPKFLYYSFHTSYVKEQILSTGMGSVVEHIRVPDAKEFLIKIPPLKEQKAIASVLSSLDDKIDLLHRQNKTLEAMAETLFRQWFVEEAEADWEEKSLLEIINLVGGGTPKTSIAEYWDGGIPWLSGGDIATNHKDFIIASEKTITQQGLENSAAKLLPKFATVISARGTVGKFCLLAEDMTFSQSNYGILPKIEGCYFFTYLLVNYVVEELQSAAYGSVFDTITTATFRDATFAIPSIDRICEFETDIKKYFQKKLLNRLQIRNLEKLRNALLPMLMNRNARVI